MSQGLETIHRPRAARWMTATLPARYHHLTDLLRFATLTVRAHLALRYPVVVCNTDKALTVEDVVRILVHRRVV